MARALAPDPLTSRHVIPGTRTLKNKLGIEDRFELEDFERAFAASRRTELMTSPLPGALDFQYLKAIHGHLFQDVYEWAGQVRTVPLSKGDSLFARPEYIERAAGALFGGLRQERHLRGLDRAAFIERAAHYFGEINALHPFREGNGRTQRAFIERVAQHNGRSFAWSRISQPAMIDACVHAMHVDSSRLAALLDRSLIDRLTSKARAAALDELARSHAKDHAALVRVQQDIEGYQGR